MTPHVVGWKLSRARRKVGLTQSEVAARMGTTQSAVSRLESGRAVPSLDLIGRYAEAVGEPVTLTFGERAKPASRGARRRRVRAALGDFRFDPWERDPSAAEARTLHADRIDRGRT